MLREGPEGFEGGLSAGKYASITGASPATATRDLADLVAKQALVRSGKQRHTRYEIAIPLRPVLPAPIDQHGNLKSLSIDCRTRQTRPGRLRKQRYTMTRITRGTTNIFADLGYPDAAGRQTKTRLALAVNELLKARKLKQREIGILLGVPQPKVSALKNYRLDQFSVERLMEFLTALNQDVEIMIRPRANSSETGHISVLAVP